MTEERLIITFKRSPKPMEPRGWSAFDVNEANVTEARDNFGLIKHDMRELYHLHRAYEEKRRGYRPLGRPIQSAPGGSWRNTAGGRGTGPRTSYTS